MRQTITAIAAGYGILLVTQALFSVSQAFVLAEFLGTTAAKKEQYEVLLQYLFEAGRLMTIFFAGYMTAKIAGKSPVAHSIAVAGLFWVISMILNYFLLRQYGASSSFFYPEMIFHILYTLGVCGFGGFVYKKRAEKNKPATTSSLEEKIERMGDDSPTV